MLAIPILVRPLHAISRELGAWTIDIARMHAARCLFDVARDSWSLREGYSAKKAETGTLPVGARDPNFSLAISVLLACSLGPGLPRMYKATRRHVARGGLRPWGPWGKEGAVTRRLEAIQTYFSHFHAISIYVGPWFQFLESIPEAPRSRAPASDMRAAWLCTF